ncbi:MAG: sterol desaturase family protein [Acidobacteriia bacterium]|nr:sterol desaturase family protein [Terriglobia bacterium]
MLETFGQNLREVLGPLAEWARHCYAQLIGPNERHDWLWLVSALIATDLLYRFWNRPKLEAFWSYAAPWRIYSHPSAVLDYKFIFVDRLVMLFVVGPMLVSALALGNWGSKLLAAWLGPGPAWTPSLTALIIFGAVRLLLFDLGHYIGHYILHKVPFFWEFHKVHHSAEVLTPVTAYRVHPVEEILVSVFQGPLQALGIAGFYYLYGADQTLMTFVGMNAVIVPYFLIGSLTHSHVWISFGPALEHIFISPAQHQVHHSTAPQHLDTNLAQYFSLFDWIGGTLYIPKGQETLDFGLSEGVDSELKTVWSLYWVPLKRAFGLLLGSYTPLTNAPGSETAKSVGA